VVDREVAVEREQQEAMARQGVMAEELRKAELVRDRLESLEQSAKAYPEGHDIRVLIEGLHLEEALRAVEEYIRTLREALIHPRGSWRSRRVSGNSSRSGNSSIVPVR
jgi:hypothetical protein